MIIEIDKDKLMGMISRLFDENIKIWHYLDGADIRGKEDFLKAISKEIGGTPNIHTEDEEYSFY